MWLKRLFKPTYVSHLHKISRIAHFFRKRGYAIINELKWSICEVQTAIKGGNKVVWKSFAPIF